IACLARSSRGGGDLSAQPPSAAARAPVRSRRAARITSVQLQDEVVQVRADPQDHLADDVHGVQVIGIDGRVARSARSQEHRAVAFFDVELDGVASGRRRHHARHRDGAARLQLPLALRPNDRVHLALDDFARQRLERELDLVARLDLVQLVLVVEADYLAVRLEQRHDRVHRNAGDEPAGTQLQVDDVAFAGRARRGLLQHPACVLELRAHLRYIRDLSLHRRAQLLLDLQLARARLRFGVARRVELALLLDRVGLGFLEVEPAAGAGGDQLAVLEHALAREVEAGRDLTRPVLRLLDLRVRAFLLLEQLALRALHADELRLERRYLELVGRRGDAEEDVALLHPAGALLRRRPRDAPPAP